MTNLLKFQVETYGMAATLLLAPGCQICAVALVTLWALLV